ncbi:TIP41-like family-domain-containing protein [Hygrophoropsis aurantiaca]|uniref:TIP41-like family-domain-containing protein n=1 Tax=Hygrophoropsis aurantiaca TaxID=72124 RepID=A0ACB8A3A8_9AGAM|nr:TIP41-like family-domain-containing protein [Hygrophoropsis aurantiaca]
MSSAIALPPHELSSPNQQTHTIKIANWRITASTHPISNAAECDALQSALGFALPEMTFGGNSLLLEYNASGVGWKYVFDTRGALGAVKGGELGEGDGGVKVGYADAWLKSRTDPGTNLPLPATMAAKPYDWTYTTTYAGHPESPSAPTNIIPWTPADPANPAHIIPMAELTRPDPILFYAEIPLFEDELHDNGSSSLIVRIRVMPTCIFILSRFTLRVDNVLFRTHDTRVYHSFVSTPPLVVRQVSGWAAPYDKVKRQLPDRNDLTPLTDATFVARVLAEMPAQTSQKTGAGTGWRGLGTKLEVAVLEQPAT